LNEKRHRNKGESGRFVDLISTDTIRVKTSHRANLGVLGSSLPQAWRAGTWNSPLWQCSLASTACTQPPCNLRLDWRVRTSIRLISDPRRIKGGPPQRPLLTAGLSPASILLVHIHSPINFSDDAFCSIIRHPLCLHGPRLQCCPNHAYSREQQHVSREPANAGRSS
jgi:hypothetical protein